MDKILEWVPAVAAWFVGLFTQLEWKSMVLLVGSTMAFTQTLKVTWRVLPIPGGGDHRCINVIAALASFVLSFFIWPVGSIPWFVAGIISGPLAVFLFKFGFGLLRKFLPTVAAMVNMDRRKRHDGLPPGVVERRSA